MFECCYAYEEIMRMEREELNRKLDWMANHGVFPVEFSRKNRIFGNMSLFMVFFRNIVMN